ncbi:uncharacterized protein RB166_016031 [Leptodactylus fuscus]|uniref:uncharacterized protein LOC142217162 n=1 Tax=Leptodactylus fuscus TaxID=238119 RepID=UPI003F4E9AC6
MSHTVFEDWIVGVFGILVMAFFIGCSSCWQFFTHKSADPAGRRRHPPPPPSPGLESRYESNRYHQNPTPVPEGHPSSPQKPREIDEDSEEDFEELQDLRKAQQSDVNGQNSATSWKCAEKAATRQDTYVNTDVQDYVNLQKPEPEIPIYVKIIDSDPEMEVTTPDKEKKENKTPRSAINSIGKYSSQSDSLCHSYENLAVEAPLFGSESDMDYVNTSRSSALEPFCH